MSVLDSWRTGAIALASAPRVQQETRALALPRHGRLCAARWAQLQFAKCDYNLSGEGERGGRRHWTGYRFKYSSPLMVSRSSLDPFNRNHTLLRIELHNRIGPEEMGAGKRQTL